ncbi:hypothetical protein MTO96_050181 [Rhipicephalus appendiculatus]
MTAPMTRSFCTSLSEAPRNGRPGARRLRWWPSRWGTTSESDDNVLAVAGAGKDSERCLDFLKDCGGIQGGIHAVEDTGGGPFAGYFGVHIYLPYALDGEQGRGVGAWGAVNCHDIAP